MIKRPSYRDDQYGLHFRKSQNDPKFYGINIGAKTRSTDNSVSDFSDHADFVKAADNVALDVFIFLAKIHRKAEWNSLLEFHLMSAECETLFLVNSRSGKGSNKGIKLGNIGTFHVFYCLSMSRRPLLVRKWWEQREFVNIGRRGNFLERNLQRSYPSFSVYCKSNFSKYSEIEFYRSELVKDKTETTFLITSLHVYMLNVKLNGFFDTFSSGVRVFHWGGMCSTHFHEYSM